MLGNIHWPTVTATIVILLVLGILVQIAKKK